MSLPSDPRPAPFTVEEFSDLVSSAFNLHHPGRDQPLLAFTPPSPLLARSPDRARVVRDPDDDLDAPARDDDSPFSSPRGPQTRSRTITALDVLHHVRERASALVLRSRAARPSGAPARSAAVFEPLPPLSLSLSLSPVPSASSFTRALSPWSMLDLSDNLPDRPRSRAGSLPRAFLPRHRRDATPPPPLPALPRSDSPSGTPLHSFFDDSPVRSKRAYTRPSTSHSTLHPLSNITTANSSHSLSPMASLPSFFDHSGYDVAKPSPPSYSRPVTPLGASHRVHSRLPPLRKSKSNGHSLLGRGHRRGQSKIASPQPLAGLGYPDLALWSSHRDDRRAPSPFTHPRDPPPIPETPTLSDLVDADAPLPPPYVFERRGSAASASTASTRSTSSLSSRLSHIVGFALPSKMRSRARSKLNLTIAITPEALVNSSPSTHSSGSPPSTPSSPVSSFSHSQSHALSANTSTEESAGQISSDEDALAIGRVLTPEADPFAKAEIAIPVNGAAPASPSSHRPPSHNTPPFLTRNVTWDTSADKPRKKSRNSLPASPVSTAYTFPSSCSIRPDGSPGSSAHDPFASVRSVPSTPQRLVGPPSAWSLRTPPATPSSEPRSSPAISPQRSPHMIARSSSQRSYRSPRSNLMQFAFPLPPTAIPATSPRRLETTDLAASPLLDAYAPPVPSKDRHRHAVWAHKSLPPSPIQRYEHSRECTITQGLAGHGQITEEQASDVSPSLSEGLSGIIYSTALPARSTTPVMRLRLGSRRRSVDSTSTITASPGSSAVHGADVDWGCATSSETEPLVSRDRTLGLGLLTSPALSEEDAEFWSPLSSSSTVFYSAQSSADSRSLLSYETGEDSRACSLEG